VADCRIGIEAGRLVMRLAGAWQIARLGQLDAALKGCPAPAVEKEAAAPEALDGSALDALDTAAALQLCGWLRARGADPATMTIQGFDPRYERVLRQVAAASADQAAAQPGAQRPAIARLGALSASAWETLHGHLSFLGFVIVETGRALARPGRLRVGEIVTQLWRTCVTAVPVVALVTALIGLVFAYLLGLQAEQYGANIFVVDGVALGMTREFSPLIVAVIVAGRSGASFAAQLGTMRLNEETDAIAVLGLSVAQVLVVPRVLALVLALPLLVFVGDLAGLAGAAVIASTMLDVTPSTFVARLHDALAPRHAIIGLVKAPVFALLIAVIGCRMGMSGSRDTRTIGINTTSTVVQSIVGVIVIDALFAVLLQEIGW
jgi:phospholipid/cholesterol/gamma-HCH transport system permease protein